MIATSNHQSVPVMHSRSPRRPQAIRRRHRPFLNAPARMVLNVLVGAVVLLTAQSIANALLAITKIIVARRGPEVAHAEQATPSATSVSAPALSTRPSSSEDASWAT